MYLCNTDRIHQATFYDFVVSMLFARKEESKANPFFRRKPYRSNVLSPSAKGKKKAYASKFDFNDVALAVLFPREHEGVNRPRRRCLCSPGRNSDGNKSYLERKCWKNTSSSFLRLKIVIFRIAMIPKSTTELTLSAADKKISRYHC